MTNRPKIGFKNRVALDKKSQPRKKSESQFHAWLIFVTFGYGKISALTTGLANVTLKIRVFTGFLTDVKDQNLELRDLPETRKLG